MYENLGHSAYEEAEDFNKKLYDFLRNKYDITFNNYF